MSRKTTQWFLSLQMTIFLLLIFVRGNEDAEDAYKNGKHLVLEYFLPINLPATGAAGDVPLRREKRDVEGSGEDEAGFGELKESEDADNSTRSAIGMLEGKAAEGSGEVDDGSEMSSEEEEKEATTARIMGEAELLTMPQSDETTKPPDAVPEVGLTSTEMVFDRAEDFEELSTSRTEETSTEAGTTPAAETTTLETTVESRENESTTPLVEETTKTQTTTEASETTTEPTTVLPGEENVEAIKPSATEATTASEETTTAEPSTSIPVVIPQRNAAEEESTVPPTQETKTVPSTVVFIPSDVTPDATEGLPAPAKTPATTVPPPPVVEEVFKETKVDRKLEALPGNILQKENLSLAADPLLIVNTRLMDSEENVQLSSAEPKRLGAYIVIALILLSFMTLVGYITFKKRMTRKRQEFESNQESNDTEKALLSLSDYKDSSELEENHLKNNEITPIVVKSNTQINRFEKNTNFSSPKNLNTIANEKNIEKDNVLKSTAENLTQVIIEDSPKDVEEDKTPPSAPGMERLIVKTRIDQDSIPKKAIIINRTSTGYMPIPQDN